MCLMTVVIENLLHFLEAAFLEDVIQVGVPDSKTLETRLWQRIPRGL